jgi:hypothetical protein
MENQIKKSWPKRHPILTTLGVIIALGYLFSLASEKGASTNTGTASVPQEQAAAALKVSAETLRQAYKANEVSGDNQYKGKLVEIAGTIDSIGKDITDEAYVTFETPESVSFDHVQCMFKKSEEATLGTLTKGQKITLQGTVSGASLGSVIVRGCTVVGQ